MALYSSISSEEVFNSFNMVEMDVDLDLNDIDNADSSKYIERQSNRIGLKRSASSDLTLESSMYGEVKRQKIFTGHTDGEQEEGAFAALYMRDYYPIQHNEMDFDSYLNADFGQQNKENAVQQQIPPQSAAVCRYEEYRRVLEEVNNVSLSNQIIAV